MSHHNASRNWFRLLGLAGAFAAVSAFAAAYPVCPPAPEPVHWNGGWSITLDRDIESCRVFSWEYYLDQVTGFYFQQWQPYTPAAIQSIVDSGRRVVLTDRLLAGARTDVIEYLNTGLNHYFLALPDEAGAIERGDSGPGWVRTGYGFTARTVMNSPISRYVYRYYGSIWPGPNSHFFTIDVQEALMQQNLWYRTPADQPRWNAEGYGFNAYHVLADGTCADNQVPVWRAFNGGPQRGIQSNHRFSADKSVIDGMVSQGWIAEGVAFCVEAAQ